MSLLRWMPGDIARLAQRVEERIRGFYAKHGKPILYVGFSGGKDSAAVLAAAVNKLGPEVVVAWYWHIPGQTHRDNLVAARSVAEKLGLDWETHVVEEPRHVREIAPTPSTVHHVIVGRGPYWGLLRLRGPPAPPPQPRWCCRLYKEEPLTWTRPWKDGRRYILTGAKRADSRARAKRWQECERTFRPRVGPAHADVALAPLCDLNDSEVWALLEYYGIREAVEGQYRVWGRSPNCALCPLASKSQLAKAARLLPKPYVERFLDALEPWESSLARRMRGALLEGLSSRKSGGEVDG